MAVDGRSIGSLHFTLKVRADRIVDGPEPYNKANLQVTFLRHQPPPDRRRDRSPAGSARSIGADAPERVRVPETAREAIIRIGLGGATGRLYVDAIKMTAQRR